VSFVSIAVTVLMIVEMLYLVWGAPDSDIHKPGPSDNDQPELDDSEDTDADEASGELPRGNVA